MSTSQDQLQPLPTLTDDSWYTDDPTHLKRKFSEADEATWTAENLEIVIQDRLSVLRDTSFDHPDYLVQHMDIANGYLYKYLRSQSAADLDLAIDHQQTYLDLAPNDHPNRAIGYNRFGLQHMIKYQQTKDISCIERAITNYQMALSIYPDDDQEIPELFDSLASAYIARCKALGTMEDVETAIKYCTKSVATTTHDSVDKPGRLNTFGSAYQCKYDMNGERSDLQLAIQYLTAAYEILPRRHDDRVRVQVLTNLGRAYQRRYVVLGAIKDLDSAVELLQEALGGALFKQQRRIILQHLSLCYKSRYRTTDQMMDLDNAIHCSEESLQLTPLDGYDRANHLRHLGAAYNSRYLKTRAENDVTMAVKMYEEAIALTPDDHLERASQLQGLGSCYHNRHIFTGSHEDLDKAIGFHEKVLNITPGDHPRRARRLQEAGCVFLEKGMAEPGVENTLQQLREAYATDPNLALKLSDFQRISTQFDALRAGIHRLEESVAHAFSPAKDRLAAGKELILLYLLVELWKPAYNLVSSLMALLALVVDWSLEYSDKQRLVAQNARLGLSAGGIALMAGEDVYEVLKLIELGRGIIMGSSIDLRTEVSALQEANSPLADRFIMLRDQLEGGTNTPAEHSDQPHYIDRHDAGLRLQKTIQEIRQIPRFGKFLLPPSEEDMKAAAAYDPIVVINVSDYRCDAIIIEKDKLYSIRLPNVQRQHLDHLGKITKYETEMLEWLWDTIAEPVLRVLGFDKPPMDGQWPHIRWIPTGALCRIPIHAAGFHSDGSKNTVMDRVISSYSPSVKALIDGLERHSRSYQGQSQHKAVLFGSNQLRYAPKEIDEVEKICRAMKLEVVRPQARQEIVSNLDNCAVFHFAGHGLSDGSDPSKSSLVLGDNEMLTVASLLKSNLRHQAPFLAYLSACGTGQTKQYRLFDEGIHLIGAYQISGFQNVVGTLWEVEDRSCVEVATRTYEWIKNRGMSRRSVAEGLHHAARKLRSDWIDEISQPRTLNEIDSIIPHDHDIEEAADGMGNGGAVASRDMEPLDNPVLNWIPYVHYC
ncbi:hypothetical protein V2G26_005305 [Clonostachys chloroleuca]